MDYDSGYALGREYAIEHMGSDWGKYIQREIEDSDEAKEAIYEAIAKRGQDGFYAAEDEACEVVQGLVCDVATDIVFKMYVCGFVKGIIENTTTE
jgi:hypothetical protein